MGSDGYGYFLVKAAQANTYVETVSDKADSLHRRIGATYEENIVEAYKESVKAFVREVGCKRVIVAVDLTDEPFYGATRNLYTQQVKGERGYGAVFQYAVISIVDGERSLPLLALPVRRGAYKGKIVQELVKFAKSLVRIRMVLLDRGFYTAEVINALGSMRVKFLLLAIKTKAVQKYAKQTFVFGEHEHEMILNKNKTNYRVQTRIVVVKHVDEYDWTFATNLPRQDALWYICQYKKRWQIETNFRVEDEAHIKSKSVSYLIRYFYFITSLLLHAIWLVYEKTTQPFKAFLINTYERLLCSMLGIEHTPPST